MTAPSQDSQTRLRCDRWTLQALQPLYDESTRPVAPQSHPELKADKGYRRADRERYAVADTE